MFDVEVLIFGLYHFCLSGVKFCTVQLKISFICTCIMIHNIISQQHSTEKEVITVIALFYHSVMLHADIPHFMFSVIDL